MLVTTRVGLAASGGLQDPVVCRWDVESGRLLSRASLPCANPILTQIAVSPDGRRAVMGEVVWPAVVREDSRPGWRHLSPESQEWALSHESSKRRQWALRDFPAMTSFASGSWYLHDGVSGKQLTRAISGLAMAPPDAFSADGRWFWGRPEDPYGDRDDYQGVAIYSAETGSVVVKLDDRFSLKAGEVAFAPDGTSAVVLWQSERPLDESPSAIQVIDLPSGKQRQWVELPPRPWTHIHRWDGRRLDLSLPGKGNPLRQRLYELPPDPALSSLDSELDFTGQRWTFDLIQEPMGEGTPDSMATEDLHKFWYDGLAWRAVFTMVPPAKSAAPTSTFALWVDWLLKRIGIYTDRTGAYFSVRFVDPATGVTRYEVPRPVRHPCLVSADGRRMACSTEGDGVEVWDTDPPPRWPWAAGAGIGGMALALALHRRVRRAA
jgi:hypothetical protein